jgi:hypothetical protein
MLSLSRLPVLSYNWNSSIIRFLSSTLKIIIKMDMVF